jgi:hypothetical protein
MIFSKLVFLTALCSTAFGATYTNPEMGYSMDYPNEWTKNGNMGDFDLFIMAPKKDKEGQSLANLSIISGELPPDIDLNQFYEENIKYLQNEPQIEIKNKGDTTIAGAPAKWIHYVRKDDQTEIYHTFFISKGKAYIITSGSTLGSYESHKPAFDSMMKSFKLNS